MPISAKVYNENQKKFYLEYIEKCKVNGVDPYPQSRYFPLLRVNYGYIVEQPCNGIAWKRRKKDFY